MCKKYLSTSEILLCFEIEKCMLDSILITQFLESLMKFIDNLKVLKETIWTLNHLFQVPQKFYPKVDGLTNFMIGNQYQYRSAHMHFCVLLNERIQPAYFFDSIMGK